MATRPRTPKQLSTNEIKANILNAENRMNHYNNLGYPHTLMGNIYKREYDELSKLLIETEEKEKKRREMRMSSSSSSGGKKRVVKNKK
jgi:hypothetical protein